MMVDERRAKGKYMPQHMQWQSHMRMRRPVSQSGTSAELVCRACSVAWSRPGHWLIRGSWLPWPSALTVCVRFCRVRPRLLELGATQFYRYAEADDVDGLETVVDPWMDDLWEPLKKVVEGGVAAVADEPTKAAGAATAAAANGNATKEAKEQGATKPAPIQPPSPAPSTPPVPTPQMSSAETASVAGSVTGGTPKRQSATQVTPRTGSISK